MPHGTEHRLSMHAAFIHRREGYSCASTVDDNQDVDEFPLLLQANEVRELIEVAQQQGFSAAGLARHLIRDYLLWLRSDFVRALGQKQRRQAPGETR